MKKFCNLLGMLLLVSTVGFSQHESPKPKKTEFYIKAGGGTSWISLPKVFLTDPSDPDNNWQILPAKNFFTGYLGLQALIPINDHWLFVPEVDFTYISGQIRIDALKTGQSSQKLQSYTRIEIPLNLGALSYDNFWISFGPVIFFTISDNKGFDAAFHELTTATAVNSDNPVGFRFRLAAYASLSDQVYLDVKIDSDLYRNFEFKDGAYHMKMSMQSITFGLGWRTTKD